MKKKKAKIIEMKDRMYIPRTKVAKGTIIIAEYVKRKHGLRSTGKAIELMLLESPSFNLMLDELKSNPGWKYGEFSTSFHDALKMQ